MHSHNIAIAIESTIYVLIHLWKTTTIYFSTPFSHHSAFFLNIYLEYFICLNSIQKKREVCTHKRKNNVNSIYYYPGDENCE